MTITGVHTRILDGFDDPGLGPDAWHDLLAQGDSDVVFLTWHWLKAWWEVFGQGQLMLILVQREGRDVALAPFYSDAGMVFFVGSGASDYLDFIGDVSHQEVLDAILVTARCRAPGFLGFRFYHVPANSGTGERLKEAAGRLGMEWFWEGRLGAPRLEMAACPQRALQAANKKSLVRHERFFQREGTLNVRYLRDGPDIMPHLDDFFSQHVARWEGSPHPSLFLDSLHRRFYKYLVKVAAHAGWLRFTRVEWNDKPIAFHFGFCYKGSYLWYKPTFDIELARHSPGEVLLRQLVLQAIDEQAGTFDFGLGEEAFKRRFATYVSYVDTWGLYPASPTALHVDTS